METALGTHGTEIEFPRMQYIDPFGLDYMLRVFRNDCVKASGGGGRESFIREIRPPIL